MLGARERITGDGVSFRHDENVLKLDSGDGCTSVNILITRELDIL